MGYQPAFSGASISDPDVAYIRSDGSDTTGNGSPSAPYLTAQKAAVTEGFTRLNIGIVNAGNITWGGATSRNLVVSGMGSGSIIGTISTEGGSVTLVDVGVQSVAISTINTSNPVVGGNGGGLALTNVKVASIVTTPVDSPNGGTPAGNAGAISLTGSCAIGTIQSDGASNTDGGTGGDAANITISGPSVVATSVTLSGGDGGTPGADGTLTLSQGARIPTPSPDAATVIGAIINDQFYANAYP